MKQVILILLLAIVLALSAFAAIISTSADEAISAYSEIQARPPSAAELAMKSRQTPAVADDGRRASAGMFGLSVMVLAGLFTVAVLTHGQGFLKQWRMTMKKQRPQQRQPTPQPPYLGPAILPPVDQIGRTQRPLELPQWTDSD